MNSTINLDVLIRSNFCAAVLIQSMKTELITEAQNLLNNYFAELKTEHPLRAEYFNQVLIIMTRSSVDINKHAKGYFNSKLIDEIFSTIKTEYIKGIDMNKMSDITEALDKHYTGLFRFYFSELSVTTKKFKTFNDSLHQLFSRLPQKHKEKIMNDLPFCFIDVRSLQLSEKIRLKEEEIKLFRAIYLLFPYKYYRRLFEELVFFAHFLSNEKLYKRSVELGQEAIDVFQKFPSANISEGDVENYGILLMAMGYRCSELNEGEQCLYFSNAAVKYYEMFIKQKKYNLQYEYADALDKTGLRHMKFKKNAEALNLSNKAVAIYKELYKFGDTRSEIAEEPLNDENAFNDYDPDFILPKLMGALVNNAQICEKNNKQEEALVAEIELSGYLILLEQENQGKYNLRLAKCFGRIALLHQTLKQYNKAIIAGEKALVFYRKEILFVNNNEIAVPAVKNPSKPNMAFLLRTLAELCLQIHDRIKAGEYVNEAIGFFKDLLRTDKSGYYYAGELACTVILQAKIRSGHNDVPASFKKEVNNSVLVLERLTKEHPGYYIEELEEARAVLKEIQLKPNKS